MKETKRCKDEGELSEILMNNLDKLTCFNCGKFLEQEINNLKDDIQLGILYYEREEVNYPREPDIPSNIYFECMECNKERKEKENVSR